MSFNFRHPEYFAVYQERAERLAWIRADPTGARLANLKLYYKDNPADFISDWGETFDPRASGKVSDLAAKPFILFPKQREWIQWVLDRWKAEEDGLTEKSRDMGVSWLAVALGVTLCLFNRGLTIGYGSALEIKVDRIGDPDCLFWKARYFRENLPPEFQGDYDPKNDSPHMRLMFRETASAMTGAAGDNIGRGGRSSLFIVDEAAHLMRPKLIDAALSQTTNCRIDLSSVNGMANPFAEKRWGGKIDVFTFHWRDDPRKDDAWYAKQQDRLDAVILAQEVDINYSASQEGVVIPQTWVQSAIDAHLKLNIPIEGELRGAMDVADEGKDKNAYCLARGILIEHFEEWTGKDSDIFKSVQRVFGINDDFGCLEWLYDADGMGADVRGNARVINEWRKRDKQFIQRVVAFRGSGAVDKPEAEDAKGRKNKDYFANAKAQAWYRLRRRFMLTHRAVTGESADWKPEQLISLSSKMPLLSKLTVELSQPTWEPNGVGKMVVNKAPDDVKSPNLADTVMMRFSGVRAAMRISDEALERAS